MQSYKKAVAILALCLGSVSAIACNAGSHERSTGNVDGTNSSISDDSALDDAVPPYDRSQFAGDWGDADDDCLNTRMEILADWSSSPVQYDESGCRIVSGRWVSEYTDDTIYSAADIDIDHVVPLAYAWRLGAYRWSKRARHDFFNDGANLLPVELSLNRAKGDSPPSEWLPPMNQCRYVSRFKRVTIKYHLVLPVGERRFIDEMLRECGASD